MNIKIKLLLFSIAIIFPIQCYSQYFKGGIVLGITASQIDGDTYAGYHQPGLSGGVYTSRVLSKNLTGIIELKYSAKGARETGDKDEPMVYSRKLRYVELPLKINCLFTKYKLEIEAGFGLGYLFNAPPAEYNGSEVEIDYEKHELFWTFGACYQITDILKAGLHFNYSLFPIWKHESSDYHYGYFSKAFSLTNGYYNNVVDLSVYYQLGKN